MKQSTRNIFKMHGWRADRALHNYLYFAFYDIYVKVFLALGGLLAWLLRRLGMSGWPFKMVYDRYHAKVLTYDDAAKILTLNEDIVIGPDRTERIIPYQHANNIILKEPDFIAVMDCPCRKASSNPCLPLDVCMAVGRTTAQFWLEHGQKYHAKRITQPQALERLRQGRERGHITTAWFKVATGGRTGVICSCCTCCCGGLHGMRLARTLKGGDTFTNIVSSGYVAERNKTLCDSCGACATACIFAAATLRDDGRVSQDYELCMGCGLCVESCKKGARKLVLDPDKGLPLDIDFAVEELGLQGGI
jgi:Pyruvate/2-oxoacid:ferredoxin oxidoreductase delta subunit